MEDGARGGNGASVPDYVVQVSRSIDESAIIRGKTLWKMINPLVFDVTKE